jgi:adenylate cyclase
VDDLLPIVVDTLLGAFAADRVAIVLRGDGGALELRIARDTHGSDVTRTVPRAIVNGVAERQTALLTHDAREDTRTAGASVVAQAVRSAMAAPLIGDGHLTLGVLYVDSQQDANAFDDHDLNFLVAFAGIAAAAVEREASATRLRRATHVRENFERYFTPQLAARIAASTETMSLGGHRQRVVVLFSDIRGFTAVAESLPPMEMAKQLNEYFEVMVRCVFAHEGALDKFIGDALLAYWGAPEPHADDAARAVRAAQDMRTALTVLNERWRAEGRPELHAGVAIHAGDVFLGNIGSPQRLEYTLIGDTVNLTSKLCAQAGGDELLITDAVREHLPDQVVTLARPDIVPVRRSGDATRVWAIPA